MDKTSKEFVLIVNLSLRSIRTIIFTSQGEKVYEDWLPVRTYINGLTVEQDPKEWWRLLIELFTKISKRKDVVRAIGAISVTSSSLCLIPVDVKGEPLTNAIMVSDKRAIDEAEVLKARFGEFLANGGFKIDASFMLPKMLWLKKNQPSLFSKTAKFLSANDYLIFKLTGKYVTDTLNAEKFYYQTKAKQYPLEMLSFLGISPRRLPQVVSPGSQVAILNAGIISDSFKSGIPIVVSTYDAICAVIGSCTYEADVLTNVCGTCSSYRIITSNKKSSSPLLLEQELLSENLKIIGGSNNLEGGVLEWAKECFYAESYQRDDAFLYNLMQQEAWESSLGSLGLIFLPYLIGERLPISDAYVRGMFFGLERFHTRKDIIRSVFEATAFQAKLMVEEFEKTGIPIASIIMSGGVAKLPLAVQIRADVLGIPISVVAEIEATALGAFIFTQKALAKIKKLRDGRKFIKLHKQYLPNMHNHNCYAQLFVLYKELYLTNSQLFKRRNEVFKKVSHYQKKVLENL